MSKDVFVRSEQTLAWLGQFAPDDQANAMALAKAMRLGSADEFTTGLRARILQSASETEGAVALLAEREMLKEGDTLLPLFEQPADRPRRAFGEKALAVRGDMDIGSEGLIAQLITDFSRADGVKFLNHPGPDLLRANPLGTSSKRILPVRKVILVTDLIGSGNRAWEHLEAAWRVWTVKSLWSMGPERGISFEVITYASTEAGQRVVESHPTLPLVRSVIPCPTIDTEVSPELVEDVKALCRHYDPYGKVRGALGYRDTGALIAFAHSAPNNCPRVLWAVSKTWLGLFPKRVTASMRETFGSEVNPENVNERLVAMRQCRLAEGTDWSKAPHGALERYLLLAALAHPPRRRDVIARKTGLTLLEVETLLGEAASYHWIDKNNRLTDAGQAQLSAAKARSVKAVIPERSNLYYPTSLRVPAKSSS